MKRYVKYLIMACLPLYIISCQNNELAEEVTQKPVAFNGFWADINDGANTRTHLIDGEYVVWEEGAGIDVFSDLASFESYDLIRGEHTSTGYFCGKGITGNEFYGFYPSREGEIDHEAKIVYDIPFITNHIAYVLPFTEGDELEDGEFDIFAYAMYLPMVAKSHDNNLHFKQTVGMFHVTLTGNMRVARIIFRGNNDEIICGYGHIDLTQDEPVFVLDEESFLGNPKQIILTNPGKRTNGIHLPSLSETLADDMGNVSTSEIPVSVELSDTPIDFYFAVPPMTFSKGVTLRLEGEDEDGDWVVMEKKTSKAITIGRGEIVNYPELDTAPIVKQGKTIVSPATEDVFVDNGYSIIWEVHTTPENQASKIESVGTALKAIYNNNQVHWSDNEDDKRSITVILPEATRIPNNTFQYCGNLKFFRGENVTSIGSYAFYNSGVREVIVPSVTNIGDYTFGSCYSLKSIDLPSVLKIGDNAFLSSPLSSISMPLLTSLGKSAFYETQFESFTFPEGITAIPDNLFEECKKLVSVSGLNITSIGNRAFCSDNELLEVNFPKVERIESSAFSANGNITHLSFPKVSYIGEYAFSNCTGLVTIKLPRAKTIGEYAFRDCSSLNNISLPKIKTIDDWAFSGCTSLSSIDLTTVQILGEAVFNNTRLTELNLLNVVQIDDRTFAGMNNLVEVRLPKVEKLGEVIFDGLENIQAVYIGGGDGWVGLHYYGNWKWTNAFTSGGGYLGDATLYLPANLQYYDSTNPVYPSTKSITGDKWTMIFSAGDTRYFDVSEFGHIYVGNNIIK